ncbi:WD40-repeat-containing domain protein [Kalmanozyma brasiliensis GHG001]|uniref:Uncharacterized protein n=1 Tax=Kalmanozyma brasiliensis (strain GHG001) TaxID=1365824 RepID=V5ESY0_KALBG|nr:WD40-repeat-containing domain protein [Kalmanozyma brasiliensis GHG001]EST08345.1 WD40-repeat-containing domain protein [Kalmanozyma brasiliensis GHG001]
MPAATRPTRKRAKPNPPPSPSADSIVTPTPPPYAHDDDDDADFDPKTTSPPPHTPVSGPSKPTRAPRSAPRKSRALDDDPPRLSKGKARATDEDDSFWGKSSDLELFTRTGPLSALDRIGMKTTKSRSLRPLWLQGVYQPPFFGIPTAEITHEVVDEDEGQPEGLEAAPWPKDGLTRTWLSEGAYDRCKVQLIKWWCSQVGWVPHEGVYDRAWWPGKAWGWAENVRRTEWARGARQGDGTTAQAGKPGWPFIQPWLDPHFTLLSPAEAQPYLHDNTPQRTTLRHPTTVMKLTVPELSMRNRLKRSVVPNPPKTPKKARTGEDGDDDDAASGDDDGTAPPESNQEPIDPTNSKFANIANLGFEEKGPICGDVLHVSVGPPDQETPVQIAKGTSRRLDTLGVANDEGHILNVGGHVYALDWVPVPVHLNTGKEYFVVSAATSTAPVTMIGEKQAAAPGSLQIWSVAPDGKDKGKAKLEMIVCHEAGAAFKLAWCPAGHDYAADESRRLGILAGCFADGSVSIFSVPHPDVARSLTKDEPIHIRLEPILRLEHPTQAATSLAWAGGEQLAFGGSAGWLGVYSLGSILRSPTAPTVTPAPSYVVRAHRSAITDLTFVLLPPLTASGQTLPSAPPTTLFSVSLDGWTAHTDLSRCTSTSIERSRTVHYACAFSPFSGGTLVHEHADGSVAHYSLRPEEMLRSRQISHTPSRVLALSASAFHPMLAMGSAHGEVKLANTLRTFRRTQRNHLPVYQQVVDRSTGVLTVRHQLLPEIANQAEGKSWHLAQWHPALAVTSVKWNPNLGRCRLLLSGTASGMVKVDFVKPPFEA